MKLSFGTIARCVDYAGVHIFKCSDYQVSLYVPTKIVYFIDIILICSDKYVHYLLSICMGDQSSLR